MKVASVESLRAGAPPMVSAGGPRRTTDVFIVGGGPAGLAAGIAAREQGLDVMVADGAPPLIDKAGGEGVTPNGVAALRSLGVEIRRHDAVPFRSIRFIVSGLHADAAFVGEPGWGIRRTTLHHVLVERAAAVGVRLHWQTRVLGLIPGGVLSTLVLSPAAGLSEPTVSARRSGDGSASPPRAHPCSGSGFAVTSV